MDNTFSLFLFFTKFYRNSNVSSNSTKYGNDYIGTVEKGNSSSVTVKTIGRSDSLLKININRNIKGILSSSVGLEINNKYMHAKVDVSSSSFDFSGGLKLNSDTTHSVNLRLDEYNLYIGGSSDTSISNNITHSSYGRSNINMATPILIYVGEHGIGVLPNYNIPSYQFAP